MRKFLSILIVSDNVQNTNNRAESDGNTMMLQQIKTAKGIRTQLTGQSIAYGLRQIVQDNENLPLWRKVDEENDRYLYGPKDLISMKASVAAGDLKMPEDYADTMWGFMVEAKADAEAEAGDRASAQKTSLFQLSDAFSTSLYAGCTGFGQGEKAASKGKGDDEKAEGALYICQKHYTRYVYLFSCPLDRVLAHGANTKMGERHLQEIVAALMSGIQVGGSQSRHLSEIRPAMVAWRIHSNRGNSLLLNLDKLNTWAHQDVDEKAFAEPVQKLGGKPNISFNSVEAIPLILKDCGVV